MKEYVRHTEKNMAGDNSSEQVIRDLEQKVRSLTSGARGRRHNDRATRHQHLLRVGDSVRVHNTDLYDKKRSDDFEGKRYPGGRDGVIVGYHVKSVSRFGRSRDLSPGIYQHPEWPLVRVGNWEVRQIRATYLSLPKALFKERLALHRSQHPEFDRHGPRLCDLPETNIWEGDVVVPRPYHYLKPPSYNDKPFLGGFPDHPKAFVVGWMNFCGNPGDLTESLDHPPRYSLSDRLFRRSGGSYYDSQLDLVERGNLWRRAHGEPTAFRDLEEEAVFALNVGETSEVKHTGAYTCVKMAREVAVKSVESGEGDGIKFYSDFYGWDSGEGYTILRFTDRSLGERVREATLSAGFQVPSSDDPMVAPTTE